MLPFTSLVGLLVVEDLTNIFTNECSSGNRLCSSYSPTLHEHILHQIAATDSCRHFDAPFNPLSTQSARHCVHLVPGLVHFQLNMNTVL